MSDDLRAAAERMKSKWKTTSTWWRPDNTGISVDGKWLEDMCILVDYAVQHLTDPLPDDLDAELRAVARRIADRIASDWDESDEQFIADAIRPLLARAGDNPELDATDAAHPAWWRGHDHTTGVFCQLVNDILDGKDDGTGVANEPWEGTRRRLLQRAAGGRADDGEPVDQLFVERHWTGTPATGDGPRWYWISDRVFIAVDECGFWYAAAPDSEPEAWHPICALRIRDDVRLLCKVLGVPLKEAT